MKSSLSIQKLGDYFMPNHIQDHDHITNIPFLFLLGVFFRLEGTTDYLVIDRAY